MKVLAKFKYKNQVKKLRKRLEREVENFADKVWTQDDTELIKSLIITKARTGKSGFTFRVDYSPEYKRKYNKRPGNYMQKSGEMLDSIQTKVVQQRTKKVHIIYFNNKDARQLAKWHNTGTARGGKIRAWWGLSPVVRNRISNMVKKRIRAINKM